MHIHLSVLPPIMFHLPPAEVEEDFIQDDFNLSGLSSQVHPDPTDSTWHHSSWQSLFKLSMLPLSSGHARMLQAGACYAVEPACRAPDGRRL